MSTNDNLGSEYITAWTMAAHLGVPRNSVVPPTVTFEDGWWQFRSVDGNHWAGGASSQQLCQMINDLKLKIADAVLGLLANTAHHEPMSKVPRFGFEQRWADLCNELHLAASAKVKLETFMDDLCDAVYLSGQNSMLPD